jgi:hypothetical protein
LTDLFKSVHRCVTRKRYAGLKSEGIDRENNAKIRASVGRRRLIEGDQLSKWVGIDQGFGDDDAYLGEMELPGALAGERRKTLEKEIPGSG